MCLLWSTDDDILRIRVNNHENAPTKRGVLQKTHLNFDYIGFSAPFLLEGKQVFQELCAIKGLGWDDEIPPEIHKNGTNGWRIFPPKRDYFYYDRLQV